METEAYLTIVFGLVVLGVIMYLFKHHRKKPNYDEVPEIFKEPEDEFWDEDMAQEDIDTEETEDLEDSGLDGSYDGPKEEDYEEHDEEDMERAIEGGGVDKDDDEDEDGSEGSEDDPEDDNDSGCAS